MKDCGEEAGRTGFSKNYPDGGVVRIAYLPAAVAVLRGPCTELEVVGLDEARSLTELLRISDRGLAPGTQRRGLAVALAAAHYAFYLVLGAVAHVNPAVAVSGEVRNDPSSNVLENHGSLVFGHVP